MGKKESEIDEIIKTLHGLDNNMNAVERNIAEYVRKVGIHNIIKYIRRYERKLRVAKATIITLVFILIGISGYYISQQNLHNRYVKELNVISKNFYIITKFTEKRQLEGKQWLEAIIVSLKE